MITARQHIQRDDGPVLIDCQTYRLSGHSPSDASSYRTKDELDLWTATDPITAYFDRLVAGGVVAATRHEELKEWAQRKIKTALEVAIDGSESPRLSLRHDATAMAKITFNNTAVSAEDAPPGETTVPVTELPHLASLAKRSRSGLVDGKVASGAQAITFRDAIARSRRSSRCQGQPPCAVG
jgi:2-oxoisovalerate dehydrogenase E1 component